MMFELKTPVEVSKQLGQKTKTMRLDKRWTRTTLSNRSGVPSPTLRRFEDTGKISLESFLKLMNALGRLDEMDFLLKPPSIQSFDELTRKMKPKPKRGSI